MDDEMLKKTFSARLKELRVLNGYSSQKALAEAVGTSEATIKHWENSLNATTGCLPKASDLARLCDLFQCSADYLLGRCDPIFQHVEDETGIQSKTIEHIASHYHDRSDLLDVVNRLLKDDRLLERLTECAGRDYQTSDLLAREPFETDQHNRAMLYADMCRFVDDCRKEYGVDVPFSDIRRAFENRRQKRSEQSTI